VPEGTLSGSPTPARELHFITNAPGRVAPGDAVLDLRSDLSAPQREHGLACRDVFVDWLGALNRQNASLGWWGYTSTAKNMLSSPLGEACFGVLALRRYLSGSDAKRILVVGAPAAQRAAIGEYLGVSQSAWRVSGATARPPAVEPLLRLLWQFARIFGLWCAGRLRAPSGNAPQAALFTYVDRGFRDGPDAFFGSLSASLASRTPAIASCHVAFVHSGYLATLPKLRLARSACYEPLYGSLRFPDLLWGLGVSLAAWWRAGRYAAPPLDGIPSTALLRTALRWDLGRGGYFYNVLVYRAARRLLARWSPEWLLYPYENKSLEKMLLLAAREKRPGCRMVGYQHTSVTRRHATLLFAEGEAAMTPLPDRIVTVGAATRSYLEAHGRYPAGIFATGCALRQQPGRLLERRTADGKIRLLLALSSSRRELIEAVAACRSALESDRNLEMGVRTHPEFPVTLLPEGLKSWLDGHAVNLSDRPLAQNLEWCDVVVYVSSTVALEALGSGRPVINLAIGDCIDPDPVLDPIEFHWNADSAASLVITARQIASLDATDFDRRRRQALDYVGRYLVQPSTEALERFLPR